MKNKTPRSPPDKYTLAFIAAKGEMSNVRIAKIANVTPSQVSQWVMGTRPILPDKAQILAQALGVRPEAISAKLEVLADQGGLAVAPSHEEEDQRRPDLIINRLENDVDSLRLALGVLVGVMTRHRPAEAADVATALRKNLKGKFLRQGYVKELLEVLDSK